MDKKEPIKISLTMFLLIIAIIAIFVMGYFMYNLYNERTSTEENINNLNSQITILQDKINKKSEIATNTSENIKEDNILINNNSTNTTNVVTYNELKGKYEGIATNDTISGIVYLTLCENGMYHYENIVNTACASEGYYTFTENEITLHQIISCANDPGRTISSDIIKLKLNEDGTITDNELNTILKKKSNDVEEINICNTLKNSLKNNFLYY